MLIKSIHFSVFKRFLISTSSLSCLDLIIFYELQTCDSLGIHSDCRTTWRARNQTCSLKTKMIFRFLSFCLNGPPDEDWNCLNSFEVWRTNLLVLQSVNWKGNWIFHSKFGKFLRTSTICESLKFDQILRRPKSRRTVRPANVPSLKAELNSVSSDLQMKLNYCDGQRIQTHLSMA